MDVGVYSFFLGLVQLGHHIALSNHSYVHSSSYVMHGIYDVWKKKEESVTFYTAALQPCRVEKRFGRMIGW